MYDIELWEQIQKLTDFIFLLSMYKCHKNITNIPKGNSTDIIWKCLLTLNEKFLLASACKHYSWITEEIIYGSFVSFIFFHLFIRLSIYPSISLSVCLFVTAYLSIQSASVVSSKDIECTWWINFSRLTWHFL